MAQANPNFRKFVGFTCTVVVASIIYKSGHLQIVPPPEAGNSSQV